MVVKDNRRSSKWGLKALILFYLIPVIVGTGALGILINYLMALDSANHRVKDHIKGRRMDMNYISQLPTLGMYIVDLRLGLKEEAAFFKKDTESFVADYLNSLAPAFTHTLRVISLDGKELLRFENGRSIAADSLTQYMLSPRELGRLRDGEHPPLPDHHLSKEPNQRIKDILPLHNELNKHVIGAIVYDYGIPVQELLLPVKNNLIQNILLAGITAVIISLVTYWVLERNIKPLRHLKSLAQNMIEGDLTKPVELKGRGETRLLADSFESMRQRLKQQIELLTTNSRQLAESLKKNKHSKEQLKIQRDYSDAILQGTPNFVCGVTSTGFISSINPSGERISGYSANDLLGKSFRQTFFSTGWDPVFEDVFKDPTGKNIFSYECDLVTRSGETKTLLWSSLGHSVNLGDIKETIFIGNDVTDRKAAEQEVRKFRTISDRSNYGCAIYDLNCRLTYINDAYADMHGYQPSQLIGRKQSLFFGAENIEEEKRLSQLLARQGYLSAEETVHFHKDGRAIPILLNSMMVKDDDGSPIYLSETVIDISEKKLLEEQLQIRQRMDSLGTLAGGIAHDFNNLLAGISGYVELLQLTRDNFTETQKNYLGQLVTSVRRATELIHQFQTLSHGSVSKKQQVDLGRITSEVFNMLDNSTDRLIQKINLVAPERFFVRGNQTELCQVLLNLGVNANEAIESKGTKPEDYIRVEAESVTIGDHVYSGLSAGQYIHLRFSDTGCGMTESIKARAFDPLFSSKKKSQRKGQGLGLAMAFNIIKNHNGHIAIDSTPNNGTTFDIYLPGVAPVSQEVIADRKMVRGTETVLYVDDEDLLRPMVREFLGRLGYSVMTAADGVEGLKKYKQNQESIDIVILDMIMPRLSGKMLFEKITAINPDQKIIIASGQSEGRITSSLRKRVNGFIGKPPGMMELSTLLRQVLDD